MMQPATPDALGQVALLEQKVEHLMERLGREVKLGENAERRATAASDRAERAELRLEHLSQPPIVPPTTTPAKKRPFTLGRILTGIEDKFLSALVK
jgi:hypothetical protein